MRSLVADDVSILRRIIENIIKPYFDVVLAENGQLAYDLFEDAIKKNNPFDIVFLDILMPKLNGIQALQMMRQCEIKHGIKNKTKIIMITGLNDQHSVKQAVQVGCNGYVLKPYSQSNVLNALKKQGIDVDKLVPVVNKTKPVKNQGKQFIDKQDTDEQKSPDNEPQQKDTPQPVNENTESAQVEKLPDKENADAETDNKV